MEKGLLDFFNSSQTGNRCRVISDLQNDEERVSFHPGNRKLI